MAFVTKFLDNEKGSTLMMSVITMIFLMIVTTALIIASTAHYKAAIAYEKVNNTYYDLDENINSKLMEIDRCLQEAEIEAQKYLDEEGYKQESVTDSGALDGDLYKDDLKEPKNYYNIQVATGVSYSTATPYQTYYYDRWMQFLDNNMLVNESDYNDNLKAFTKVIFKELYFMIANEKIESLTDVNSVYNRLNPSLWYIDIKEGTSADQMNARINIIEPTYEMADNTYHGSFKLNPVITNALTAGGDILIESGDVRKELDGDIFSQGNITIRDANGINSTVTIKGNIYTANNLTLESNQIEVSNYISNYSNKLELYNNASANNKFFYLNFAGFNPDIKYDEYYGTDQLMGEGETNAASDFWFYHRDSKGGNVYAQNIVVKNDSNESVSVEMQNAWIKDDLVVDSAKCSSTINGTIIGLQDRGEDQGNGIIIKHKSSTIQNNGIDLVNPANSSTITLNKFFIPGLSYIGFDNDKYFRTIESVTAKNPVFLTELYDKDYGFAREEYVYEDIDTNLTYSYHLTDLFSEITDINFLRGIFNNTSIEDAESSISINQSYTPSNQQRELTNGGVRGYALGGVFSSFNNSSTATQPVIVWDSKISDIYAARRSNLLKSFDLKTKQFGIESAPMDIQDYLSYSSLSRNINIVGNVYYPSYDVNTGVINIDTNKVNNSLTIIDNNNANTDYTIDFGASSTDFKGIIYVNGNLTLTGDITYKGTIITSGNLAVKDKVDLQYDESVIKNMLTRNPKIMDVFNDVTYGKGIKYTLPVANSGHFGSQVKRYEIERWQFRK